jgi:hypothetical protein
MSFPICKVFTLVRFLTLLVYLCVGNQAMRVHWSPGANKQPKLVHGRATEPESSGAAEEKQLRELIGAWCSAYSDLNPKQMDALETAGVEVVDGFGDLHYFLSRNHRERFWADGFEMIDAQEFHPQCVFQQAPPNEHEINEDNSSGPSLESTVKGSTENEIGVFA